jgi:nicotinate-nucleotide adenylyltransferase
VTGADSQGSERLGVFGGTFDPFHTGHLVAAQDVLEKLGLARIVFVPAGLPPHKGTGEVTPGEVRLRMVREAVAADLRFDVSEIEVERDGPSWTVDTLRALTDLHPGSALHLIMGADQWAGFPGWRDPRGVAALARIVVMSRSGDGPDERVPGFADGPPPPFRAVEVTRLDISSTELRRRVREGRSIRYLVPDSVDRLIEAKRLYL